MTENKRFTLEWESEEICQVADNGNYMGTDEVVELLNELNDENKTLKKENEQLKQQLLYDGDDVCGICKHEYLTPSGNYFIGKCEKGHEECSTEDIQYCEDFELKELLE